jgi:hypothetical protein
MGNVSITIEVEDEKANTKINATAPNVSDLSVALAQIELMKYNLLTKIAKHTKIKDK